MSTNVASIGKTKYKTIQAAVDASKIGDIVMLIDNTTENVTIPQDKDIIFDMNGFTLSGGANSDEDHKGKAAIYNNGKIVIKDTSANGTGMIKREDVDNSAYYVLNNQNIMTIESGTIYNNSGFEDTAKNGGASLICNADEPDSDKTYKPGYAKLYIEGGVMHQDNFIVIKNGSKGYIEMTGGEVTSANESAFQNWAEAHVTGGTINGLVWILAYDAAGDSSMEMGGDVVVNGKIWTENYSPSGVKKAEVVINGGTYVMKVDEGKPGPEIRQKNGGKVKIRDGNFNIDPTEFLVEGAEVVRGADGKFYIPFAGCAVAIVPKHPVRNVINRVIYADDDASLLTIIDHKVSRKMSILMQTCYVAICVDGKYYPVYEYNFEEQFELAKAGKPLTVEADPDFGRSGRKLENYISASMSADAIRLTSAAMIRNSVAYGNCIHVNDPKTLGIEGVDQPGYWMVIKYNKAGAEAEGYHDVKFCNTDTELVDGDNFIKMNSAYCNAVSMSGNNYVNIATIPAGTINIIGKLTVDDVTTDVNTIIVNRMKFVNYDHIDNDIMHHGAHV